MLKATTYMCNASTYLGKTTKRRNVNVAHEITMNLAQPFLDTGRNITMDNWFTSLPLAKDLFAKNTTVVGTIRKKPYIPSVMLGNDKNRPVNTSSFLFDQNTSLVSYKVKKNKTVMLLSTLHHQPAIGDDSKPEIVHFYNKTKGGVDVLDHNMCGTYCTSRKTKRWPCCMFFGLLNIAIVNAFVLYKESGITTSRKDQKRRLFMHQMAYELTKPLAAQRVQERLIKGSLLQTVKDCFDLKEPTPPVQPASGKARCKFCHWKTASRCRSRCSECNKVVCAHHYKLLCPDCVQ